VSARRQLSPRVARQRALVADLLAGILLAVVALTVAAGIGVVAVGAVLALLVVLAWAGAEAVVRRMRPRR
jgi:hypothetical protein